MEERAKDIRPFQPVIRHKCLLAEVAVAVQTFIALNAVWLGLAAKESRFFIPPSLRILVIPALFVGTVRWLDLDSAFRHTPLTVQDPYQMQSSKHNLKNERFEVVTDEYFRAIML